MRTQRVYLFRIILKEKETYGYYDLNNTNIGTFIVY